jgi:hypothetical protein
MPSHVHGPFDGHLVDVVARTAKAVFCSGQAGVAFGPRFSEGREANGRVLLLLVGLRLGERMAALYSLRKD